MADSDEAAAGKPTGGTGGPVSPSVPEEPSMSAGFGQIDAEDSSSRPQTTVAGKPTIADNGNADNGGGGGGGHGLISGDVKQYTLEGISPGAFLALFTVLNMFIYGDRGLFGVRN
jgi:hypothetical protein